MHYIVASAISPPSDSIAVPVGATVTWVNCEDAGRGGPHHDVGHHRYLGFTPADSRGPRFAAGSPQAGCTRTTAFHIETWAWGKLVVQ